jgi:predicted transcriptional regulator of viral defense system
MNGDQHEVSGYSNTLGLQLIESLTEHGNYIFNVEDAKAAAIGLDLSDDHLRSLLSALSHTGWLLRLRRGLYAIGEGPLRGAAPHPFAVATRLVEPSAISHWSALQHHGLTDQVPRSVTATTPRKVVTPSMRTPGGSAGGRHAWTVGEVRYEFVAVRPESFFGVEDVWIDQRFRVPITDRERTVLDCFAAPDRLGGIGEGLGVLEEHMGTLDLPKLAAYAERLGKVSVMKRLGWALDRAGASPGDIAPLRAVTVRGYVPLDPALPRRGPCDRTWSVQDNTGIRVSRS